MLVLAILVGAALPLAAAYAWGVILLRRLATPPEIALAVGAAFLLRGPGGDKAAIGAAQGEFIAAVDDAARQ